MEESKKKVDFRENDNVFSQAIKAGKRIYYLDVKKNRKEELFLAITESKRLDSGDGTSPVQFEKHKIFLYKEDFDKFAAGLDEALDYIRKNNTVNFVPSGAETAPIQEKTILEEEIEIKIDF